MYSLYSKNKPKSDDIMTECGSLYFAVSALLCLSNRLFLYGILSANGVLAGDGWKFHSMTSPESSLTSSPWIVLLM